MFKIVSIEEIITKQSRAVWSARQFHKLEVVGSNPISAIVARRNSRLVGNFTICTESLVNFEL